jgi:D-amino-acid dehydrogenase
LSWQQWRWSLLFLGQCNDRAFERNVQQLVALGAYSHDALKDVVRATGIDYHRLEKGIAHYYTDQKSFDTASDESGDARAFTQALAARCAERGAEFLYGHDVVALN